MNYEQIISKYNEIYEILKDYESSPVETKPNYYKIKVNILTPTGDNADKMNKLLSLCKKCLKRLKRTESDGIKIEPLLTWPSYDFSIINIGCELIILIPQGFYRLQFRSEIKTNKGKAYSGTNCYYTFLKMCKKYGVDIYKYELTSVEGLEAKEQIPMPLIKLKHPLLASPTKEGKGIRNVHHIDFHHSYPAGLINTHPEFKIVFEKITEELPHEFAKAVLNLTIGYFQSKYCNYKFAGLARDAIIDNIDRLEKLADELETAGRNIIAYNTDGIWYSGEIFHSSMEGEGFGCCENDHKNCYIRFKSVGAYEYIENGVYKPVVRGATTLDATLPREQWKWGDIYNSDILVFRVSEEGITYGKEKEIW